MCGRPVILGFAALVLLVAVACNAQYEDESSGSDYIDNQIDLVPTYRTGIEKILQGLASVVSPGSSSSSRSPISSDSSESRGGKLGRFFGSFIPKPIKKIIAPVEKETSKGFGDILNHFEDRFHAIFPGTLWCGGGNIAKNEEDVGLFDRTDACCRAHDNCPSNMSAGEKKGILLNNGIFTRSACFCDQEFYQCLKNVSSVVSANIGSTYFNILRPQCFSYDYPIKSCAQYGKNRLVDRKCAEYNLDRSQNKTLGWFDNLDF